MRRTDKQLTDQDEMFRILDASEFGVLSLLDEQGVPYGVPMNFAREGERLIFHCASEGRKLQCFRFQPRVSFCVVGRIKLLPGDFSTEFESVIVEGTTEIVVDEKRKYDDMMILCRKLSPEFLDKAEKYIAKSLHQVTILELKIEKMTGKAKRAKPNVNGHENIS